MRNFNIQQLRSFHALMKIGNMTRAAEFLGVTQPTVSRQLQLLEDALDFRVFDRKSGGRLIATKEGLLLFEQLSDTLDTLIELPEIARSILHYESRRLRIAATTPLLNSDILIDAVRGLREAKPNSTMHLERARREYIETMIAAGKAEIGLCAAPITNTSLEVHPLVTSAAVAVMAKDHPLADRKSLSAEDVPSNQIILPTAVPIHSQLAWRDHDSAGLPPPVRVHLMLTGFRLAAAGLGVLVCDPLTATTFQSDVVKIVPWKPEIKIDYCYILPKDREDSVLLSNLVDILIISARTWQETVGQAFLH